MKADKPLEKRIAKASSAREMETSSGPAKDPVTGAAVTPGPPAQPGSGGPVGAAGVAIPADVVGSADPASPAGPAGPAGPGGPARPAAQSDPSRPSGLADSSGPAIPDLAQVASALNSGAIHLLRSLAAVDRQSGLPRARLSALSVLVFGGSRTLGELAAAEGVAGPTMTRIVDGLIAEHLAERLPHPTDGRSAVIAATTAGETLMRTAQRRRIDALANALANQSPDHQQILASAGPLLDDLAANVRARPA